MAKIPVIADHATRQKNDPDSWYNHRWKCKYCGQQFTVRYEDFSALRSHMRRKHRMFYKPYVIDEEVEHADAMSVLLA